MLWLTGLSEYLTYLLDCLLQPNYSLYKDTYTYFIYTCNSCKENVLYNCMMYKTFRNSMRLHLVIHISKIHIDGDSKYNTQPQADTGQCLEDFTT